MNLRQLSFVRETARQNLKLTAVAQILHTSQPGVSKSIIELEKELGVQIFTRRGRRLTSVTPKGQAVIEIAERILREVDLLKRVVENDEAGETNLDAQLAAMLDLLAREEQPATLP
jgi:LysR family transcriptional regulator, cys regulon transcriptional activator